MRANGVFWRTSPGSTRSDSTAHRPGEHVRVPRPQQRDVVDAVQERHDDGLADALGRSEGERRVEVRRLRRHPEHVDLAVERACDRDLDLEVAEDDALDAQPAGMPRSVSGRSRRTTSAPARASAAPIRPPTPPAPRIA